MGHFNKITEKKIKEAIPVDNSEYFKVPGEEGVAFNILKNAGVLPEELKIRKKIDNLINRIKESTDQHEKADLKNELNLLYTEYEVAMEQRKLKRSGLS